MSDCANLKAELAKLNSQVAGIGKRLSKLEDDVGKLKGNQGKVKQGGDDPTDLSAILVRLGRIEGYILGLENFLKETGERIKDFANVYAQFLNLFITFLQPLNFVFSFIDKFTKR